MKVLSRVTKLWSSELSSEQLSELEESYIELHKRRMQLLGKHIVDFLDQLEPESNMEQELVQLRDLLSSIIKKKRLEET